MRVRVPTAKADRHDDVPYGYCHCGCGKESPIASRTRKDMGHKIGEPTLYLPGHWNKGRPLGEYGRTKLSVDRMGAKHHNWKGSNALKQAGNRRARRLFKLGSACVDCGKPPKHRHHVDENPLNNNPENVISLCRRCHLVRHGMLDKLAAFREANRGTIPRGNNGRLQRKAKNAAL